MCRELYEKGTPPDESQLIAELIEHAIVSASVNLDLTVQYLSDGLMATVYLKAPHNAFWNIMWKRDQPMRVDTGMDPVPSLADPRIQELLTEAIKKIYTHIYVFCHCPFCRMKDAV